MADQAEAHHPWRPVLRGNIRARLLLNCLSSIDLSLGGVSRGNIFLSLYFLFIFSLCFYMTHSSAFPSASQGKEFETRLKEKKPGDLSDELRIALGMPTGPVSSPSCLSSLHNVFKFPMCVKEILIAQYLLTVKLKYIST